MLPDLRTRVLVVDDDPDIRASLVDVLEDEGYSVVCAANGAEALRLLRDAEAPALVLVDMLMPVMDGAEFLQRLQEDPVLSRVPALVLSASSIARPPDGVPMMRKPLRVEELLARMRDMGACPPAT